MLRVTIICKDSSTNTTEVKSVGEGNLLTAICDASEYVCASADIETAECYFDDDIEIDVELAKDEFVVTSRSGGGEAVKYSEGFYTFNHEYQDYGKDEPDDNAETIIKWSTI